MHTCSLPCVKKHKQWAQCSGIRNPAEYRKRSELATESSVDQDFNFITRVERSLQRADSNTQSRGIDLTPSRKPDSRNQKSNLDLELEKRSIIIRRAPKGFSRNKQNKTHWVPLQQCIMWTTEWVLPSGLRHTGQGLENRTVQELFSKATAKHQEGLKRKREHDGSGDSDTRTTASRNELPSTDSKDVDAGLYFYLQKPDVPANVTCLISLKETETLGLQLANRILTEFPTIFVKVEPPDKLTDPFVTEAMYAARYGEDLLTEATKGDESKTTEQGPEEGEVDNV